MANRSVFFFFLGVHDVFLWSTVLLHSLLLLKKASRYFWGGGVLEEAATAVIKSLKEIR